MSASRPVDAIVSSVRRAACRILLGRESPAVGLHDDHREAVRDHIVHLASDPLAFGSGRDSRLLVPLDGEADRPLLELGDVVGSGPAQVAVDPRCDDDGSGKQDGIEVLDAAERERRERVGPAARTQHCSRNADDQPEPGGPSRSVAGDGGERDEQSDVAPDGIVDQAELKQRRVLRT